MLLPAPFLSLLYVLAAHMSRGKSEIAARLTRALLVRLNISWHLCTAPAASGSPLRSCALYATFSWLASCCNAYLAGP